MDYQVRFLLKSDLLICSKTYTDVFNRPPWNDGWEREKAQERLADIFYQPKFVGIGAFTEEGTLIGFLLGYSEKWVKANHFYLNEMCVASAYQGRGIGSSLIDELETYCVDHNINSIYLLTAREGLTEAFYKKNGFNSNTGMVMLAKRLEANNQ
ncbi:GNAT family N-acetyltransferase [Sediminibacillus halophilus]|uniref:Acetyltransferase (GNAT) family protein n=1 Tax=Sediminibacillus halophilus TaxID=482461 RepID=A0A1G9NHR3_9BACI|nr:GNAT family N-acetyltransferase [Sediminibacillus halophilus]SDL86126.1 Acetyltransferase (GNAT) family protein [Sediminibacillus halophilus]